MDVKHFEYVLEIAECGSINKATGKLHISQPNLSVCIKKLEEDLKRNWDLGSSSAETAASCQLLRASCFCALHEG